jgi:hypothetical protein
MTTIEETMPQLIDEITGELERVVKWIDAHYVDIEIPPDNEKVQVAAGCFDIALEHQSGILLLCRAKSFALVFGAQRLIFEAVLRGLYIQYCVSEPKFEDFKNGAGLGKYEQMSAEIKLKLGDEVLDFARFRERLEGSMHHFTHTGYQHVARRYIDGSLGCHYSERDVCTAINLTALFGLQAAARMAVITGQLGLATATYEQMAAYAETYSSLKKRYAAEFVEDAE